MCPQTVTRIAKSGGVKVPRKISAARGTREHPSKQLVVQAARDGGSYPVIAEKYGVSLATVHRWANAAGIAPKPKGTPSRRPLTDIKAALRLAKSGLSARQIASRLGTTPFLVIREVRAKLGDGYFRK